MNTNHKIRKGRMFILVLLLCGVMMPCFARYSNAAEVTHYYVYLDDTRYEVSKDEYALIYSKQSDTTSLVLVLRQILGERMPSSFSVVSGEVTTEDSDFDSNNLDDLKNSDFLIQNGKLISYRGSDATVTVPNTVTAISSLAFYNNSKVKAVILPSSVVSVEKYAFYNCAALRTISFPKTVTSLADKMLYNCSKITNFVAPKASKAYQYAKNKDLAVTTTNKTQFACSRVYLLSGDKDTIPLLNCISSVKWKSKKSKIVSVNQNGKITAKKKGTTTIEATANGKKYRYKVTVYGKEIGKRVNQIIKSVIKKDMTNYQKVLAVHNWMIRNVKYDYYSLMRGYVPSVSHTAKGALIKKVAVCDGYSHAFQMVMQKLKIPCRFVTGSSDGVGHAWNMVKLSGKWYHIDVTFDDPIINGTNNNKTPYYTYFLKSSSVMKKTHNFKASRYPKCTSKKYD